MTITYIDYILMALIIIIGFGILIWAKRLKQRQNDKHKIVIR